MKNAVNGFKTALAMYSVIPVKSPEWDDASLKYMLCFLPVIGLLTGVAGFVLLIIFQKCGFSGMFYGCCMALLPVFISGGLHMDGLMDTSDAIFSRRDTAKKHEILKDPHTGSFAVLGCVSAIFISASIWNELYTTDNKTISAALGSFVISRAIASMLVVQLRPAKTSGLVSKFASSSGRNAVTAASAIYISSVLVYVLFLSPPSVLPAILIMLLNVLFLKQVFYKQFGGFTGDLAGFFITVTEIAFIAAVLISKVLTEI